VVEQVVKLYKCIEWCNMWLGYINLSGGICS